MSYFKLYEEFVNEAANVPLELTKVKTPDELIKACGEKFLIIHSDKGWHKKLDARSKDLDNVIFIIQFKDGKIYRSDFVDYWSGGKVKVLLDEKMEEGFRDDWGGGRIKPEESLKKIWEMFLYNRKRGNLIVLKDHLLKPEQKSRLQNLVEERDKASKRAWELIQGEKSEWNYEIHYANEVSETYKKRKFLNPPPNLVWCNYSTNQMQFHIDDAFWVWDSNTREKPTLNKEDRSNRAYNFLTKSNWGDREDGRWGVFKVGVKILRAAKSEIEQNVNKAAEVRKFIYDWENEDTRGERLIKDLGIGE